MDQHQEERQTMNEEQAQERIDVLKGFYSHLATFVAVNLFLVVLNVATSPGSWWFIYPLFGWGIGLIIHAFDVFGTSAGWESRKMQELTGNTDTREELQRLSERTDNLVTILSSVDWAKIDPELLQTQKNLESTKEKVVALQNDRPQSNRQTQNKSESNQAQVTREIEKLEEFVTSSKFDYYELAAVDTAPVHSGAVHSAARNQNPDEDKK